ncbi:MAG: hypothetical protein ACM336_08650 [Acidobacteriota bacterium]
MLHEVGPVVLLLVAACGTASAAGSEPVAAGRANLSRALQSMGLDADGVVLLEGDSPAARALGFVPVGRKVRVRRIRDTRAPALRIVWKDPAEVPVFSVPPGARVFAAACAGRVPLMAGIRTASGAALWVAVPPGDEGYERFPYLPQALADLGARPRFESRRLWAFYDSAFHEPPFDPDALAAGWRKAGISALHVGAWDFFEPDEAGDRRLRDLIAACHRHLILVYAWLELPHVSDKFWQDHPEWREKTARLKDAAVDWRLLMNLANPACRDAVARGVIGLARRFDWDGVNLAELYYDGIEGLKKPAEFTPMNNDVRREFRARSGIDPHRLFDGLDDPARERAFLDYRAGLAARLQEDWTAVVEKTGLPLALTHVDDRFDTSMRDAIGADAARALKLLDRRPMTFIIEDPATLWHLGPKRYAEIARRYEPLTAHQDCLGVDINIVDRYRRGHPTARQTGAELFELIHTASEAFAQVAFYAESTVLPVDLPLLAASSAVVTRFEREGARAVIESPRGAGVRWDGPVLVDGEPWAAQDGSVVWLPPGRHTLAPAPAPPPHALLDFNGELDAVRPAPNGIELDYHSKTRALALVNFETAAPFAAVKAGPARWVVTLPPGAHIFVISSRTATAAW